MSKQQGSSGNQTVANSNAKTGVTAQLSNKQDPSIPTLGILEEDDEFEEFPIEDWDDGAENKLDIEQWEADWDDDNLDDDFSITLRKEMDRFTAEQAAIKQ